MKRILAKIGVLGTIFVAALLIFSILLNRDETENAVDPEGATLPVMYMEVSGTLSNRMFGYREPMEEQVLRESLTPLSTDRNLTMAIRPYGNEIKSITYEVHSVGGDTLIENSRVGNLREDGEVMKADFHLNTPVLMNQEYMLMFIVDIGEEQPVYYYTRLIQRAGLNVSKYLEFVQMFYEKALDKESAKDLTAYIEPDETVTNSSFHEVNIHSSFDQLTWGEMKPQLVQRAVPIINEMNETTTSITQNYVISTQDEDDNTEYYSVTEFYRMRYTDSRVRLLDFERTTTQIFDGNLPVLTSTGINLGIVGKDVQYVTNANADIVAFVQNGELWSYNRSANKTTKIFSYRSGKTDEREEYLAHDIKIVRVSETGDVVFVVYGYMNGDRHEGYNGIAVYHYYAERNVVQEEVFVPSNQPYAQMKQDLSRLTYVNRENQLFFLYGETLYQVDIETGEVEKKKENLSSESVVISRSHASIAWTDQKEENGCTSAVMMSLEDGTTREITAPEGQKMKILGFINEDFVYGLANEGDILTDASGNVIFGMNSLQIVDFEGNTVREYKKDGVYITDVDIQEGLLDLQRANRTESGFTPIEGDVILNNLQQSEDNVSIHLIVSTRRKTQVVLEFTKSGKTRNMLVLSAKHLESENDKEIHVDYTLEESEIYYVYARGQLLSKHRKVNEAVMKADENMGVVLNQNQQYIWERGNQKTSIRIDPETLPQAVLDETLDENALQTALGDSCEVLNLSGCSLNQILYQVGQGYPVIAKSGQDSALVIVGYDQFNTWVYDAQTQKVTPMGLQDSTALFQSVGNIFLSYVDKPLTWKAPRG